ncbi:penicillin-binding protein activator LpoB [Sphaerotilus sp.]|jgi:polysaccharide biosynthesis protein PelC|uniref:penicillin-binding protein activator LpoB n=1 Tax=Sphaerotilus sp. TaxID=2093942 RepID=UPI0025E86964|nr:penicillin-binding protein activator LpoB [Sphaerotilus sp.]
MRLDRLLKPFLLLALALGAAGCSVMDRSRNTVPLDAGASAKWVILPMANHTETPQAALRAEVILEALMRQRGVQTLVRAPAVASSDLLGDSPDRKVQQDAQRWAAEQGVRYAMTGAVDEWRYKVGVDGEPAVGLVLQVIDLSNGNVVWTATGARSGWSREALSAVGQKLMRDLLGDLSLR